MKLLRNTLTQIPNSSKSSLLLILGSIIFPKCQPHIINLQEVDLIAPAIKNSVKLVDAVDSAKLDLNFNFFVNNKSQHETNLSGHTKVNGNNFYELEPVAGEEYFLEHKNVNIYNFKGNNLTWTIPSFSGSINMDFKSSKFVIVTLGADYSKYKTKEFYGFNLGLAFYHNFKNLGLRFDTFIKNHAAFYNLKYINAEEYKNNVRKVFVIEKSQKDNNYNIGYMLSMNTTFSDWFVNMFVNYSFGWHTFYSVAPDNNNILLHDEISGEFKLSNYYSSFSIGLYQDAPAFGRIILGYNIINFNRGNKNFLLPGFIFQIDFNLFSR